MGTSAGMGTLSGKVIRNQPLGQRGDGDTLDHDAGEGARGNLGEAPTQEPLGLGTFGRARGLTVRLAVPVLPDSPGSHAGDSPGLSGPDLRHSAALRPAS